MSASSVPSIDWQSTGLVIPDETAILAGAQTDIDTAFGGGTNPALDTPQGQLASSLTAVIADKNNQIALVANQVDPQYADGRWQDAIGRIYFLTRTAATATVVTCTLTGTIGAVIPAGTLAQDTNGNTYSLLSAVTIGQTGQASGQFQNVVTGPIACPAGTLTQVYQAVIGWDAVTNPTDGAIGQNVESRSDFEYRRKNSVAANGKGTPQAIYGAVFSVANVLDCYAIDNPLPTAVSIGATSYPVKAHSLFVSVVGGTDAAVAAAIFSKKDAGCDMNGNTSVTVYDTSYSYPQPQYTIQFERPSALAIKFAIQIVNEPTLPANIISLIRTAIINKFNGVTDGNRERIASTIFASNYYSSIASAASNVSVISCLIGTSTATLTTVAVGIDQYPTISASDISVTLV